MSLDDKGDFDHMELSPSKQSLIEIKIELW